MRKTYLALIAAATLTAGTFGVQAFAQQSASPQSPESSQNTSSSSSSSQLNTSSTSANADLKNANAGQMGQTSPHADDIRKVLARVTDDAVKGKVDDVADNFASNSKDQFKSHGKHADNNHGDNDTQQAKNSDQDLKETSKQLQDAWKAKYNHDFSIGHKNDTMVYNDQTFMIMQGDLSNQARQAGERMNPGSSDLNNSPRSDISGSSTGAGATATPQDNNHGISGSARVGDSSVGGSVGTNTGSSTPGAQASTDVNRSNTASNDANDRTAGERLASGRIDRTGAGTSADVNDRMATVMVHESHGTPAVTLTLVNEGTFGNKWLIQPPPGLDYQTLSRNLNDQLKQVLDQKDQWPNDENQAYQMVSHRVLAAIANPEASGQSGQQGMSGRSSQQMNTENAQPAGSTVAPQSPLPQQQPSSQTPQSPAAPDQSSQNPSQNQQSK